MRNAFEAEGEIRGTDLLAALVALWREGASGTLQFSRSGATAGFDIAAGDVVRTASSDSRFDTAAILVRAGKLDQPTLERLPVGQGGDRAAVALQTGVLTRREWRWGEKIRAVEVLSDLLTWLEGDYWFFRTGAQDASEFRLTIPRLVLELFLRSRDRNLILHYLGGADVPLARAAAFDAEFPSFGLTADAESVVQLIDGERTAEEIASEAPADAFAVEKLLAALVTLGLVHPEFAPGEEPAAAPPFPEGHADDAARADDPAPDAAPAHGDDDEGDEDVEARTLSADRNADDAAPTPQLPPSEPDSAAPEPPTESAPASDLRIAEDDAEESLAGGSFEEAAAADSYDDEYEEDEPEPGDEDSSLDDREFDHDGGAAPASPSMDAGPSRFDAMETGSDRERDLGDEPIRGASPAREAGLEGDDREDREDSPAEAPSDLLGLDEAAPSPPLPFERPLDTMTGVGGPERPRPRSGGVWLWVLALLAVAVIAAVLWRSREAGPAEPAKTAAGPTAVPTAVELSATAAAPAAAAAPSPTAMRIGPTARPAAVAAVPSAAPARPTAPPTAAPPPAAARHAMSPAPAAGKTVPAPPAPRPRSSAPPVPGSDASRQAWVDRAERDQRRYVQEGKARFAVQLELACEVPSLADAFQHDRPANSMWLLATPYQGRSCFRVLWGRYSTREEASRGLARAPSFFSTPRNHPAVVPIR